MAKKGDYKIPFDSKGNLLAYARGYGDEIWKDNDVITAELEFVGFRRGRSAAHAVFKQNSRGGKKRGKKGARYTMFLTDLSDAIPYMIRSYLSGYFRFQKRGQNYGIKYIPPLDRLAELS